MRALHRWLTTRNAWQSALVLFAAGALMTLGFAPTHCWPVIFISLPVFYWVMDVAHTRKQKIWRAFFFGYGYCMAGTWWIGNALLIDAADFGWMLPFSIFGLSAVMAVWFLLFGFFHHLLRARMTPILFAVLWVVVEYLRSFGIFGFPWNLAGYMALASLPFAQLASVIGTYGLSLLVVLLGLLPLVWVADQSRRAKWLQTALVVVIAGGCFCYGSERLDAPTASTKTFLRLVQPNIPQSLKGTHEGQQMAIDVLGKLSVGTPGGPKPDAVIWPETAYPFTLRSGEHAPMPPLKLLVTGMVRAENIRPYLKIWNSLAVLDSGGLPLAMYDKHQLVPLGEFVPLRDLLPLRKITAGDIDFSRGEGPRTITVPGLPPFSPLICYEAIFPQFAVDETARPEWMLNVTNDAWYGDSPGPYQHFEAARMRAIEQGLPLVRAANNGISAVIDPYGRVISALNLNQRAFMDARLPAPVAAPPYAKYGELITLVGMGLLFLCTLTGCFRSKK